MKKKNSAARKSIIENEKLFAEQWKEVVKKYPIVAARYLELLEILIEQWNTSNDFHKKVLNKINLKHPSSPFKVSRKFSELVLTLNKIKIKVPPPKCRPAINVGDIKRYVNCLNKRITMMTK